MNEQNNSAYDYVTDQVETVGNPMLFNFEPTYSIEITEGFIISCISDPPNWFHRKMMNLFFGWKFELNIKDK